MIYSVSAIVMLVTFYCLYFGKILEQKKQGIKTNQIGIGTKEKKVRFMEILMSCATVSACIVSVGSIFLTKEYPATELRVAGILLGMLGVAFFALAIITMKTSWRVGIPEEKTMLVTKGIYRWSRNPAFVGFDLLYLSVCFLFFNIPLALFSLWAMIMLHIQILQEEQHMENMFGEEYRVYKSRTLRYFGRR